MTKERGRAEDGENFRLSSPLLSPVHSPDLRTAQPGVCVFNFSCLQRSCAGPFLCPAQLCGSGQCRCAAPLVPPLLQAPQGTPGPCWACQGIPVPNCSSSAASTWENPIRFSRISPGFCMGWPAPVPAVPVERRIHPLLARAVWDDVSTVR